MITKKEYQYLPFQLFSLPPKHMNLITARQHIKKDFPKWKTQYGYLYPKARNIDLQRAFAYRYFDEVYSTRVLILEDERGKVKERFMRFIMGRGFYYKTGSRQQKPTEADKKAAQNREFSMIRAAGGKEYWEKILFD